MQDIVFVAIFVAFAVWRVVVEHRESKKDKDTLEAIANSSADKWEA